MLQTVYLEIMHHLEPGTLYFGSWCSICGVLMLVAYMYLVECDGNCVKETQLQNLLLLLDRVYLQRLHNVLGLFAWTINCLVWWWRRWVDFVTMVQQNFHKKQSDRILNESRSFWNRSLCYIESKVVELGVNCLGFGVCFPPLNSLSNCIVVQVLQTFQGPAGIPCGSLSLIWKLSYGS